MNGFLLGKGFNGLEAKKQKQIKCKKNIIIMQNYEFALSMSDRISSPMNTLLGVVSRLEGAFRGVDNSIVRMGFRSQAINQLGNSFQNASNQINAMIQPAIDFERQLAEVKAMTGVTDAQLKLIAENAKGLASRFGGDAAQGLGIFQNLLSKLSPEIAKNPKALELMAENVYKLSKTMKGDIPGATNAVTTAMNAFEVDLTNPQKAAMETSKVIDLITKSAKVGSAEVPQMVKAMETLGSTAKNSGVNLSEQLAVLQVLDQKGFKQGAEGGIAFRNVLANMGEGRFIPKETQDAMKRIGVDIGVLGNKSLSFADRLKELSKIQNDSALVSKFFGKENMVAGQALLANIGVVRTFTKEIKNSAGETDTYANTIMNTYAERLERVKGRLSVLSIELGKSVMPYMPLINAVSMTSIAMTNLYPLFSMLASMVWSASIQIITFSGRLLTVGVPALLRFSLSIVMQTIPAMLGLIGRLVLMSAMALPALIASLGGAGLAMGIFNAIAMINPFILIMVGAVAVIGLLAYLTNGFSDFTGFLYSVGQFILKFNPISMIISAFDYLFGTKIFETLGNWFKTIMGWLDGIWKKSKEFFNWVTGSAEAVQVVEQKTYAASPLLSQTTQQNPANTDWRNPLGILNTSSNSQVNPLLEIAENTNPKNKGQDILANANAGQAMAGLDAKNKKGLDTISGGGPKSVTINLQKLQDKTEIHTTNLTEGATQAENTLLEMLLRVLNGANQAIVN
jgi:TP901 family phage tail tape measure protein